MRCNDMAGCIGLARLLLLGKLAEMTCASFVGQSPSSQGEAKGGTESQTNVI